MRTLCLVLALMMCLLAAGAEDTAQPDAAVEELQNKLALWGYYGGVCDGISGESTVIALENFQIANGLAVTGRADAATNQALADPSAVSKEEYLRKAGKGVIYDLTLSYGDSGKTVKRLQTRLNELGFFSGKVDGLYAGETQYAVKLFQLWNDLPVTGVADSDTLYELTSPAALAATPEELAAALRYGDEGTFVKRLQLDLKALGFFSGDCSGKFGRKTQEAMVSFQKANSLSTTGECPVDQILLILSGKAVTRMQADETEATKRLILGDEDPNVGVIKSQLNALGFYTGEMSSLFTQELAQSMGYFQEANQLSPTGIADTDSRVLLNSGEAVNMDGYIAMMKMRSSHLGDAHYGVILLQKRLMELGYYKGAVTGSFDKATENAVMQAQKVNMLAESGEADQAFLTMIYGEEAFTALQAEESYYARLEVTQRQRLIDCVCEKARAAVGKPFEGGKAGPDSFGNAGLVYFCFDEAGVHLEPTVMLQLERARERTGWSEDASLTDAGRQVFYRQGESTVTGILVEEGVLILAASDSGMVIAVDDAAGLEGYEFIGSVSYF